MSDTKFTQRARIGVAGSFFNQLMSNNASIPEVGKGATVMLYSDRHAYQVMSVDLDKKTCVVQRCNSKRTDNNGAYTESQDYDYSELSGRDVTLVYRQGAWRVVGEKIVFEDEYRKKLDDDKFYQEHRKRKELWDNEGNIKVVEGVTRIKKTFEKINILFGRQEEYRDPCF